MASRTMPRTQTMTRMTPRAAAPASFKVAFLDSLYLATPEDIANNSMEIQEA